MHERLSLQAPSLRTLALKKLCGSSRHDSLRQPMLKRAKPPANEKQEPLSFRTQIPWRLEHKTQRGSGRHESLRHPMLVHAKSPANEKQEPLSLRTQIHRGLVHKMQRRYGRHYSLRHLIPMCARQSTEDVGVSGECRWTQIPYTPIRCVFPNAISIPICGFTRHTA